MNCKIEKKPSAKGNSVLDEKIRRAKEQLWLNYYNEALYKEGLLTQEEYRKMQKLIVRRKTDTPQR